MIYSKFRLGNNGILYRNHGNLGTLNPNIKIVHLQELINTLTLASVVTMVVYCHTMVLYSFALVNMLYLNCYHLKLQILDSLRKTHVK